MGLPARLPVLFPRVFRGRDVGRSRRYGAAGLALATYAAAADHEHAVPAYSAAMYPRGDRGRQGRGLSLDRQVDRAPVRQVRLSGARPRARADDVQVWRLDP